MIIRDTIIREAYIRRFQEGSALFSTITAQPTAPHIGLSATADAAGKPHLFVGSCLSLEGNTFNPVMEIDFAAALVRVLGQVLSVP